GVALLPPGRRRGAVDAVRLAQALDDERADAVARPVLDQDDVWLQSALAQPRGGQRGGAPERVAGPRQVLRLRLRRVELHRRDQQENDDREPGRSDPA